MKYLFLCLFINLMVYGVHAIRGKARMMDIKYDKRDRGTWYTGNGLKNAACFGINGLAPFSASMTDMIGAMAMDDHEECYKCMEIKNNDRPGKKIVVKIIDKCAACEVGGAIDLTPKAFKILSDGDLDIGVLDIDFKHVRCPKKKGLFPKLPSY